MKVCIECTLHAGTGATVELPDGKVWEDVEDWYVKWDTLNLRFKGEHEHYEIALGSETLDVIDWKRPVAVTVYPADDGTGRADYDVELASS